MHCRSTSLLATHFSWSHFSPLYGSFWLLHLPLGGGYLKVFWAIYVIASILKCRFVKLNRQQDRDHKLYLRVVHCSLCSSFLPLNFIITLTTTLFHKAHCSVSGQQGYNQELCSFLASSSLLCTRSKGKKKSWKKVKVFRSLIFKDNVWALLMAVSNRKKEQRSLSSFQSETFVRNGHFCQRLYFLCKYFDKQAQVVQLILLE